MDKSKEGWDMTLLLRRAFGLLESDGKQLFHDVADLTEGAVKLLSLKPTSASPSHKGKSESIQTARSAQLVTLL